MQADKHRRAFQPEAGHYYWLSTRNLQLKGVSKKFRQRFVGPYLCLSTKGPTARLQLPPELASLHPFFHASLLKSYQGPPIPTDEPELDPVAGGEQDFEVEAILDSRLSRGRREYLIKWKNFDQASNSWEPLKNLTGCQDLV